MRLLRQSVFLRVLLLAAASGLAPGCTLFDDYVSGTPFTLDQPVAAVALQGEIIVDRASGTEDGCPAGRTVLWGMVRNTGDIPVVDVSIDVDAFGPTGTYLGTFRNHVFNGEILDNTNPNGFDSASTSLEVEQAGTFEICTSLTFGSVARTEYRTAFCYLPSISQDGVQELICE